MGAFLARFRRDAGDTQARGQQPSRINEQDKAVLSLKQQRDKLQRYQKKINIQMETERGIAKQLLRDGKKERAKLLLKKKRYLESLLEKTDQQLDNLQQMVETIEYTQVEMQVVEGLKTGNECLDAMHQMMSVEDVERIMSETQDAIEYQREIDELLGQNLTQEDEDAIAQELEDILAAALPSVPQAEVPGVSAEDEINELPEVPTHEPAAAKEKRPKEAVPA